MELAQKRRPTVLERSSLWILCPGRMQDRRAAWILMILVSGRPQSQMSRRRLMPSQMTLNESWSFFQEMGQPIDTRKARVSEDRSGAASLMNLNRKSST